MTRSVDCVFAWLLLTVSALAWAESPSGHPCAAIAEPTERLACYDAAVPPAPLDPVVEQEQVTRTFGLSEAALQARDPSRARSAGPERIEAAIVEMGRRSSGERLVTLDNGQVWLLTEVTVRGPLSTGDRVAVRKAAFGSHMLLTPAGVALRARRVE